MDQIFRPVFMDNKLSVGYMSIESFVQNILERSHPSKESAQAQEVSRCSLLEVQLYFH